MASYLQETIAALEKRRNDLREKLQPELDELAELDSVLQRLKGTSPAKSNRRGSPPARPDTRQQIHALLAASKNGLKAAEIAEKADLSLPTVYNRTKEMIEDGEVTKVNGRFVTKAVVPGAEAGVKTISHPPSLT